MTDTPLPPPTFPHRDGPDPELHLHLPNDAGVSAALLDGMGLWRGDPDRQPSAAAPAQQEVAALERQLQGIENDLDAFAPPLPSPPGVAAPVLRERLLAEHQAFAKARGDMEAVSTELDLFGEPHARDGKPRTLAERVRALATRKAHPAPDAQERMAEWLMARDPTLQDRGEALNAARGALSVLASTAYPDGAPLPSMSTVTDTDRPADTVIADTRRYATVTLGVVESVLKLAKRQRDADHTADMRSLAELPEDAFLLPDPVTVLENALDCAAGAPALHVDQRSQVVIAMPGETTDWDVPDKLPVPAIDVLAKLTGSSDQAINRASVLLRGVLDDKVFGTDAHRTALRSVRATLMDLAALTNTTREVIAGAPAHDVNGYWAALQETLVDVRKAAKELRRYYGGLPGVDARNARDGLIVHLRRRIDEAIGMVQLHATRTTGDATSVLSDASRDAGADGHADDPAHDGDAGAPLAPSGDPAGGQGHLGAQEPQTGRYAEGGSLAPAAALEAAITALERIAGEDHRRGPEPRSVRVARGALTRVATLRGRAAQARAAHDGDRDGAAGAPDALGEPW